MTIIITTTEYAQATEQMNAYAAEATTALAAYTEHYELGQRGENSRDHSWQRRSSKLWREFRNAQQLHDDLERFLANAEVAPEPEPPAPAAADDDPELWWGAGAGPATGHQRRSDGMAPISEPEISLTGNPAETVAKIERDPTDAELQETVDRYLRLAAAMIAAGQRDRAKRYRDKAEAALTQLKKRRAGIQPGEHPADHCAIAYPTLHRQIMNSQAGYE